VENIAHTLLGATLAKAGLDEKTPFALPALMIAANLPDVDNFFARGQSYLDYHRGITHSLVGLFGLSAALAATTWAVGRHRLPTDAKKQVRFLPLWLVCGIGIATHPFLDLLGDYGLRPFLPFSSKRYYGDLLSIVDPWLWLIFGCSLFLVTKTKPGKTAWLVLACALDALIFLVAGRLFALCWAVFAAMMTAVLSAFQRRGFRPSRVSVAVFSGYLVLAGAARQAIVHRAWQSGPRLVSDRIDKVSVLPGSPGTAGRWTVVLEGRTRYHIAEVGLQNWTANPPTFESYPKNLQDTHYRAALAQPQIATLARFARFPSAEVTISGENCRVRLRDLRYARRSTSGWGAAEAVVPNKPGRQSTTGSCP
jgi:membrane-bound metal-dependent hydrolase YbcI (DUF457 family)